MANGDEPRTHTRAKHLTSVAHRVEYIAELMSEFAFERGRTNEQLAEVWGVAVSTVANYSAEAHRRVMASPEELSRDITLQARDLLDRAYRRAVQENREGCERGWVAVSGVLMDVSGVRAPEKHQINASVSGEPTPEKARQVMQELFGSVTPSSDEKL